MTSQYILSGTKRENFGKRASKRYRRENLVHEKAKNIKNIRQISVSEMLAETIRRIHQKESVSTLFMD